MNFSALLNDSGACRCCSQLTDIHKLPTNVLFLFLLQVTTAIKADSSELIPALGLSWSNHVNTRIMLSRTNRSVLVQQDSAERPLETIVRNMEILFAPHLPNILVPYVVDHEGMKGFK